MDDRTQALYAFATTSLGCTTQPQWLPLPGDAGGRRYFRLRDGAKSWICVDAPQETSATAAFLTVREMLESAELVVPEVVAKDLARGFLLLTDLGEQLLFDAIDQRQPSSDYYGALPLLHAVQRIPSIDLPAYDASVLSEELARFPTWFCEGFLEIELSDDQRDMLASLDALLIESALAQPQVFVHRDFHCRNLLPGAVGGLGMIDFQDALRGPLCYDLVSLLKDCYLRWPRQQVLSWALAFRKQRLASGLPAGESKEVFLQWFDWMGLQRHLKVLGNFTRLALREQRTRYLGDVPLVSAYVEEVLLTYDDFAAVARWWQEAVKPQIEVRDWGAPS